MFPFFQNLVLVFVAVILSYQIVFRIGRGIKRTKEKKYWQHEHLIILRLTVPKEDEEGPKKGPMLMEQIFNTIYGMYQSKKTPRMSFEIAHLDGQIYFYVAVLKKYQKLIEGQLYAQYSEVEIEEVEDYIENAAELINGQQVENVSLGQACVAEMRQTEPVIWPFKTYEFFVDKDDKTQVDTLSGLTSAMSKLLRDEDQAWFQMVIRPEPPLWQKYAFKGYELLKKGYFHRWTFFLKWFIRWYPSPSFWHFRFIKVPATFFLKMLWTLFGLLEPIEASSVVEKQEVGFSFWEIPNKKLTKLAFQTSIRVGYLSRSGDLNEARLKVEEMASSFNQFMWPEVNGLEIAKIADTSSSFGQKLLFETKHRFVDPDMILGVDELATLYHLPMWNLETPNIAWVRAKRLEPPAELPTPKTCHDLVILGKTNFRGQQKIFGIKPDDRRRHMYIIGKTGMGKSTVLENMIFDDIQKGRGVAVIDPHGELADKVTAMIPKNRVNDAVVFDPSDANFPVSFNMLEVKNTEHRPLVASGLVGVFKKMYAESWGPRLEYILRNCILALTECPGTTLLGIPRLLVDAIYREEVLSKVADPVVRSFWLDEFAKMSDKMRTEAISPIQNKVGQFLSSPVIRNILGQPKSSIDIRHAMDTGKIFIVNLSKGKIGEDNSSLLGSMLITKFQLDAMSRADIEQEKRRDFYLYVDEFQNFATDSFATILSEARKYKLNLVMANQYVEQMEEEVMFAVFGNVGTLITFQVGFDDAEYFSKQFGEVVMPADIIALPKFTTYIRLLVDNMPTKVFSAVMSPPVDVDMDSQTRKKVLQNSRALYGREKLLVEGSIKQWSSQIAAPEVKKALEAKTGTSVRWRYDRNKSEFEDILNSAGKKFKILDRAEVEKFGIKDTVNEYVYTIPEDRFLLISRIDSQGNCFNRKENNIFIYRFDDKKKLELVAEVEKAPGWQLGVNKAIGGGFRSPRNKEEMEKVFDSAGVSWKLMDRKEFPDVGLDKSLNELAYRIVKGQKTWILISAIDPQGGCFTRNPDQIPRLGIVDKKQWNETKSVKKSMEWMKELEKALGAL